MTLVRKRRTTTNESIRWRGLRDCMSIYTIHGWKLSPTWIRLLYLVNSRGFWIKWFTELRFKEWFCVYFSYQAHGLFSVIVTELCDYIRRKARISLLPWYAHFMKGHGWFNIEVLRGCGHIQITVAYTVSHCHYCKCLNIMQMNLIKWRVGNGNLITTAPGCWFYL